MFADLNGPCVISRKSAQHQGLIRYFTGRPCRKGHISERLTKCGVCIICGRERKKSAAYKQSQRAYRKTESNKLAQKKYAQSEKGRVSRRKAENSEIAKNRSALRCQTDKFKQYQREYAKSPEGKETRREYRRKRLETDVGFKLACNLRSRLSAALRNHQKTGSAVKNLGCTIDSFKRYLEGKFTPEMNWTNYGEIWEIDHIKALCNFDLTENSQLLIACHYTNLQPLFWWDNLAKRKSDFQETLDNDASIVDVWADLVDTNV